METPWGSWSVLETGDGFQVKLLLVNPGRRLSYQRHRQRSEHWVVVTGVATCTVNGRREVLPRTATTFLPPGTLHRVANDETVPLVIVETQFGSYLGEDDVERLEDDYDRA